MSKANANPVPSHGDDQPFDFSDRYGIKNKNLWLVPAITFGLIGLIWTGWAALNHSQPELRSTLYSFEVTGEREITMKYAIERRDPQASVTCTLVTLDLDKNIVGQIDDVIAPGAAKVERNVAIPARLTPVSARLVECRIS
jgi:hypothetical protein